MPYVRLPNEAVDVWYQIQGARNESYLTDEKPVLLIIHPLFEDSASTAHLFDDPRLRRRYQMIAFDQRSHGRTKSDPDARFDACVAAADIVLALDTLKITQKIHVVSVNPPAGVVALRLAVLFPHRFLSFVIGAGTITETDRNAQAFVEIFESLLSPADPEECFFAMGGAMDMALGSPDAFVGPDMQDLIAGKMLGRYPPSAAPRTWELVIPFSGRSNIPQELLNEVKAPVQLVYGTGDILYSEEHAKALAKSLPNCPGGPPPIAAIQGPDFYYVTNPNDFVVTVLQFLTSAPVHESSSGGAPEERVSCSHDLTPSLRKAALIAGRKPPKKSVDRFKLRAIDFSGVSDKEVKRRTAHLKEVYKHVDRNKHVFDGVLDNPRINDYWRTFEDPGLQFRFSTRHDWAH